MNTPLTDTNGNVLTTDETTPEVSKEFTPTEEQILEIQQQGMYLRQLCREDSVTISTHINTLIKVRESRILSEGDKTTLDNKIKGYINDMNYVDNYILYNNPILVDGRRQSKEQFAKMQMEAELAKQQKK